MNYLSLWESVLYLKAMNTLKMMSYTKGQLQLKYTVIYLIRRLTIVLMCIYLIFFVTATGATPNGATGSGNNKMCLKRSHFNGNSSDIIAGNILAHELAHTFDLRHVWGSNNQGSTTPEHVTRDPNDPNYNALSVADFSHDTPPMLSFWWEKGTENSIYTIVDPDTCEYLGNGMDNLGMPFNLTPTDVGNIMTYSLNRCYVGFTIGQGVRIREWIANPTNVNKQSILAMRNDNPNIDLYIKDSPEDFGEEPNIVSPYTWSSPNIWIRHAEDYIHQHENPEHDPATPNYIHVKITNRGCDTSTGNEKLALYWSKAATSLAWDYHWDNGNTFANGALVGSEIVTLTLPPIEPNEEIVMAYPWFVPNPADYSSINDEPWHFCLLARIISEDDKMYSSETTILADNVRNNNNIAQKNVTIIGVHPDTQPQLGGVIAVGNPFNQTRSFNLNFLADDRETGKKIFREAEVSIILDDKLLTVWKNGGRQGNNIIRRDRNTLIVTGDNASLDNLIFRANEVGTLNVKFNFLTQEITEKELYTYHVIQRRTSNNEILGGETYEIYKQPRELFFADAGEDIQTDKNETVTFSADVLNESAIYNWYNEEGTLIYEGADFSLSVEIGKKYKLEVIALSDGYKDYAEVEVKLKPNSITTLYPNPTSNHVTLAYKINQGDSAYLSMNALYGSNNISHNYVLNVEDNELTFDVSAYPQGLYSISLITNGQISDTVTLIKQ